MDKQTEIEFRRIVEMVRAGNLAPARQAAQAALAQHPRAFFLHNILGVIQSMARQWKPAKKHFLKALKLDENNADGLKNLGNAEFRLGELQSAQQTLSRLVRLHPGLPDGWFALGNVHLARQAPEKAEECFAKALELKPDFELAANNLMWLQEQSDRLEALETTVAALEKTLPKSAIAGLYRGILQFRHGDYAAARARLEPFAFNPEAGLDMARLEGLRLHHLARAEDRLGHADAAFELFTRSNALNQSKLAHPLVRPARHIARLEAAKSCFMPRFSRRWSQRAASEAAPVFMVGFPRSGVGLLAAFLRGHSGVEIFEEQPLVQQLRKDIGTFDTPDFSGFDSLPRDRLAMAAKTYLKAAKSDRLAIDKLPLNLAYAGEILRVFPKAKFILVQRDPADCVLSSFMHPFALNDATATLDTAENAARTFDLEYSLWSQITEELSPAVVTLRYEDMVTDPARALAPVLEFLGLEWQADILTRREAGATGEGFIAAPASLPLYTGSIGRWQRYRAHMPGALEIIAPWRAEFGYSD